MIIRKTQFKDIESLFFVRERTRENPSSREDLAAMGITPQSVEDGLRRNRLISFVCEDASSIVGFCIGDPVSGEILVIAVLPEYEGQGIGKKLLGRVVDILWECGHSRLWLAASPRPTVRAHGFYRAQGWRHEGSYDGNGDEILVLYRGS